MVSKDFKTIKQNIQTSMREGNDVEDIFEELIDFIEYAIKGSRINTPHRRTIKEIIQKIKNPDYLTEAYTIASYCEKKYKMCNDCSLLKEIDIIDGKAKGKKKDGVWRE